MNVRTDTRFFLLSSVVVAAAVLFLFFINNKAKASRRWSPAECPVIRIATQADGYRVFQESGLWGVHVIHFGRHFHLMPYFPHENNISVPFPIPTYDVRTLYEKGIDSHSWLFVANKNGLVRRVTTVMPDPDFREKVNAFESDFSFRKYRGGYRGYSYDMPREVFPFSNFICTKEPFVVNVDAGVFSEAVRPETLYAALQQQCPDMRMFLLIDSQDDDTVTEEMRQALGKFQMLVERKGI